MREYTLKVLSDGVPCSKFHRILFLLFDNICFQCQFSIRLSSRFHIYKHFPCSVVDESIQITYFVWLDTRCHQPAYYTYYVIVSLVESCWVELDVEHNVTNDNWITVEITGNIYQLKINNSITYFPILRKNVMRKRIFLLLIEVISSSAGSTNPRKQIWMLCDGVS